MIPMPINFVIRFAVILFSVLILVALAIQFFFDPHYTVVFWIFAMPFILGTPTQSIKNDVKIQLFNIKKPVK